MQDQRSEQHTEHRHQIDEHTGARRTNVAHGGGIPGERERCAEHTEKGNAGGTIELQTVEHEQTAVNQGGDGEHNPAGQAGTKGRGEWRNVLIDASTDKGIGGPQDDATQNQHFTHAHRATGQQMDIATRNHQQASQHGDDHAGKATPAHWRTKNKPVGESDHCGRQGHHQRTAAGFDEFQPVQKADVVEKDAACAECRDAYPVAPLPTSQRSPPIPMYQHTTQQQCRQQKAPARGRQWGYFTNRNARSHPGATPEKGDGQELGERQCREFHAVSLASSIQCPVPSPRRRQYTGWRYRASCRTSSTHRSA